MNVDNFQPGIDENLSDRFGTCRKIIAIDGFINALLSSGIMGQDTDRFESLDVIVGRSGRGAVR